MTTDNQSLHKLEDFIGLAFTRIIAEVSNLLKTQKPKLVFTPAFLSRYRDKQKYLLKKYEQTYKSKKTS